jgi:hypothetical protein
MKNKNKEFNCTQYLLHFGQHPFGDDSRWLRVATSATVTCFQFFGLTV